MNYLIEKWEKMYAELNHRRKIINGQNMYKKMTNKLSDNTIKKFFNILSEDKIMIFFTAGVLYFGW